MGQVTHPISNVEAVQSLPYAMPYSNRLTEGMFNTLYTPFSYRVQTTCVSCVRTLAVLDVAMTRLHSEDSWTGHLFDARVSLLL